MRALLLVAAVAAVVGTSANAADMPVKMPVKAAPVAYAYNWTGWYVGAHVGYLSGTINTTVNPLNALPPTTKSNATFAGIQGGYRHQFANNVVLGAQLSAPLVSTKDDTLIFGNLNEGKMVYSLLGQVQLGYAIGRFLPYVTGGVGIARIKARETTAGGVVSPWVNNTHTLGTFGAGVNVAITNNWTAGVVYNRVIASSERYDCGPVVCGIVGSFDMKANTVTGVLEYRF